MALFDRADAEDPIDLRREGRTIVERSTFGEARRELHDERAAKIALYARIVELLTEGWVRQTQFDEDIEAEPEHELVAAIDRDEPGALDVYTDHLLEHGDPRGELAVLRKAPVPDERAIHSLEKTRGLELFGPLCMAPRSWREHFHYIWRNGWIHRIELVWQTSAVFDDEVMEHALHAPMARFARELWLDGRYAITLAECVHYRHLDQIRSLKLFDAAVWRPLLEKLPALETISIGEMLREEGPFDCRGGHPNVKCMRICADSGWPTIQGEWPSLQRLELEWNGTTPRDLMTFLRQPAFSRLTTLAIPEREPGVDELGIAVEITKA